MNLFGKAKKQPAPSGSGSRDAIQKLRDTIDLHEKRIGFLEKKVQHELETAKSLASKNKRAALIALKRKKLLEDQMNKLVAARMTLETQLMTIENASVNLETMNAMRTGASAMKEIHGRMTVEKVDETMDEIREQMDVANEISDAIAQPLGVSADLDEDELLQELEDLQQEELDAKLLDVAPTPVSSLPEVPSTALPTASKGKAPAKSEEEEELEQLRAAMAL